MTTYARIQDGVAIEIFTPPNGVTIDECFHPNIAAQFVQVPDETEPGATLANGTWTNPVATVSTPASSYVPNSMPMSQFQVSITTAERIALRAHTDPLVQEFVKMCDRWDTIDTNLPVVQFDVKYAAGVVKAPDGAPNAGQFCSNPPIQGGEARALQILAGNALAATN